MILIAEIEGGFGQNAGGSVYDSVGRDMVMTGIGAAGVPLCIAFGQRLVYPAAYRAERSGFNVYPSVAVEQLACADKGMNRVVVIDNVKNFHTVFNKIQNIGFRVALCLMEQIRLAADFGMRLAAQQIIRKSIIVLIRNGAPLNGAVYKQCFPYFINGFPQKADNSPIGQAFQNIF